MARKTEMLLFWYNYILGQFAYVDTLEQYRTKNWRVYKPMCFKSCFLNPI